MAWTILAIVAVATPLICWGCASAAFGGNELSLLKRAAIAVLASLPYLVEAAAATYSSTPAISYTQRSAIVTAQIYREAYNSTVSGVSVEHPEGWYLRMGSEVPAEIKTEVAVFPVLGSDPHPIAFTGTPAATMRASVKNMPEQPIQICTGDCAGIASIADEAMRGSAGIVVADSRRVQDSNIGQRGLEPKILQAGSKEPLSLGHWCLTVGLALLTTLIALAAHQCLTRKAPVRRGRIMSMSASNPARKA